MRHFLNLILVSVFIIACNPQETTKPDILIPEDTMVDILFDLSILESARSHDKASLEKSGIDPGRYIFQKYQIDSTQLSQNNKYYAADIPKYQKMYEKVFRRIEAIKTETDTLRNQELKKSQEDTQTINLDSLKKRRKTPALFKIYQDSISE